MTIQTALANAGLVTLDTAKKQAKKISILKSIDMQLDQLYAHGLRFERQIVNLENKKKEIAS